MDDQDVAEQSEHARNDPTEGVDESLAEDEEVPMGTGDDEDDEQPVTEISKRSDEEAPEMLSAPGSGSQALSERRLTESMEKEEQTEEPKDEEPPLEPTQLGSAIDSLMMNWCQLLTNVSVKPPVPPPSTLDHVKEVAEVCSKHFRDSAVDVTNEFTRIGIQWELEQASDQFDVEESNLDEVIARQERLLELATNAIQNRRTIYENDHPDAGKHFNT